MSRSWFTFRNAAADTLTIDILDEIGAWGVSAKDFAHALKATKSAKHITLNIDSPGGDCNDGFTIYDALVGSGAEITVNITGLAASMASVIMLAGKTINIAENGRVMIHRVTGGAMGNTDDLAAAAAITKQFEDRIVGLYMARTGKDEKEIRDLMKAQLGTWFFGSEAVDAGFADAVIVGTKARAFKNEWASLFTMLPAALFDSRINDMAENITPAAEIEPIDPPAPVVVPPAVEPGSPVEEQPTEIIPTAPVEPPAPEAVGFFNRILAAVSGDAALKNELATARAALATREGEVAALQTQLTAAQAKAAQFDALVAQVTQLEAAAKSTGLAAAEIAASHGLKPDQLAALPPPGEAAGSLLDQFSAITDPAAKRDFYKKHKAVLRKASFNQ